MSLPGWRWWWEVCIHRSASRQKNIFVLTPDIYKELIDVRSRFLLIMGCTMWSKPWSLPVETHFRIFRKSHHFDILCRDQKSAPDLKSTPLVDSQFSIYGSMKNIENIKFVQYTMFREGQCFSYFHMCH